ncbi:MAG TPA: hypothetical protein VI300_24695, partial [Solirubrobacter sp.]
MATEYDFITCVKWSRDGRRIALSGPLDPIVLWDVEKSCIATTLADRYNGTLSIAWSPDDTQILSGQTEGKVRLWDLGTRRATKLRGASGDVNAVAWQPRGDLVAAATLESGIVVWSANGSAVMERPGKDLLSVAVSWSPQGDRLAACGVPSLSVWEGAQPDPTVEYIHSDPIYTVAWSRDGTLVAIAGDDATVMVFQAGSSEPRQRLEGMSAGIVSVAFSADGLGLAAVDRQGSVRIWNTRDWTSCPPIRVAAEFNALYNPLDFHPTEPRLVVATTQGVAVWHLDW